MADKTNLPPPLPSQKSLAMSPGEIVYLATSLITLLAIASNFSFDIVPQTIALVIVLAGIPILRLWLVPMVLWMFQVDLILNERPAFVLSGGLRLADILTAAMLLVFVVATSRLVALSGVVVPFFDNALTLRIRKFLDRINPSVEDKSTTGIRHRDPETFSFQEIISGTLRIVIAIGLAALVMSWIRLDPFASLKVGQRPTAARTIQVGTLLVIAFIVIYYVIETIAWKFISKREASQYMRGATTDYLRPELYQIARQRAKSRAARRRKR